MDGVPVLLDQVASLAFGLDESDMTKQFLTHLKQFVSALITSIAASMCNRTAALSQQAWQSISKMVFLSL